MDGQPTETKLYKHSPDSFKKGREYEDFIISVWPKIYPFRKLTRLEGKIKQWTGETEEGIEIKFDDRKKTTGNIYIEMQEKAEIGNEKYALSGIYKNDNSRMFLVGDYKEFFLFSKQKLLWLDKLDPPFIRRPKPTESSIGFCIPVENARHLCLEHVELWLLDT